MYLVCWVVVDIQCSSLADVFTSAGNTENE